MKKVFFLISIALLYCNWASAQINIDKTDMPQPGQIYPKFTLVDGTRDYTATGANFIWNFYNLTANTLAGDTFVTVLSAPLVYNVTFNSPFDTLHNATVAAPQAANSPIATVQMPDVYNFYKASNTRFTEV
ncbi:MAG: hypothetical protein WCH34_18785, partial [Bacteroidota bacterium]